MATILDLEQTLLRTVRSLPHDKQEAVLLFARSLQSPPLPLSYSLLELAKLPIAERNAILVMLLSLVPIYFRRSPFVSLFL